MSPRGQSRQRASSSFGLRKGTQMTIKDLPDGTRVVRHPDGSESHHRPFPHKHGKRVDLHFGADGQLRRETHLHGMIDISIERTFEDGVKKHETYVVKRRLVSRATYEKARLRYPDMPAADPALPDSARALLRRARRERQHGGAIEQSREKNAVGAAKIDGFCVEMMERGRRANALQWVEACDHTLGEMNHRDSRDLVQRLSQLGCRDIVVCQIDSNGGVGENSSHLVVELPSDVALRTPLFKLLARLASDVGYSGEPDDGQRYAYIKLD